MIMAGEAVNDKTATARNSSADTEATGTAGKPTETTPENVMTEKAAAAGEANQDAVSTDKTEDIKIPEEATDEDEAKYPKGMPLVLIIASLCLAVFLVALDQTIIAPALGAITADFRSVKDIVSALL